MKQRLFEHLRLARPANILTAIADVLFGFAVSGFVVRSGEWFGESFQLKNSPPLFFLIIATSCLYAGGVIFNDIFDVELDKIERPERPLPRGTVSKNGAIFWGILLFLIGVSAAGFVNSVSFIIAASIVALSLLYNARGKHIALFGPLNMGLCRGANLLLGIGASIESLGHYWLIAFIPIIFISIVTMISRGEVHRGKVNTLNYAIIGYALVIIGCLTLGMIHNFHLRECIPFLFLFAYFVYEPLLAARYSQEPLQIQKTVRAGVLSLIILDAALGAGFAGAGYGIMVLALLPLSIIIAKWFAVT